jgi:hypothetical protein
VSHNKSLGCGISVVLDMGPNDEDVVITESLYYRTCWSRIGLKLMDLWSASAVTSDMRR